MAEVTREELAEVIKAFLRAPHIGSDGPGSSTVVIQEYHFREARTILSRLDAEREAASASVPLPAPAVVKADGGPAFPAADHNIDGGHWDGRYEITKEYRGMTLRDWFAGQVFGSIMCEPDIQSYTQAARRAYEAADAMLAEREGSANNG